MKAKISEIFCSFQGEGIYCGEKQIFIRFFGCNLECAFCDEKNKKVKEDILKQDLIKKIEAMRNFSEIVSITGGEPLLQAGFLEVILPALKAKKFKIYLESNGTLPQRLDKIINWLDVIAMDIKLPSSTGLAGFWDEHREFLKVAKMKRVFIKLIITNKTKTEDVDRALSVVTAVGANIPLVVQPVTPQNGIERPPEEVLLNIKRKIGLSPANVRIIPQFHKVWGVK